MRFSPVTRTWLTGIFVFFFSFLLFPHSLYQLPLHGTDESWWVAENLAWRDHLVFGRDVMFTYGPLSIFIHAIRLPFSTGKWTYIFADLYFMFTVAWGLLIVIRRHFKAGVVLYIFFCVLISMYAELYQWSFLFFALFLFAYLYEEQKPVYLVQAGLLAMFGFFCKLNLGMIMLGVFFSGIVFALATRRMTLKAFLFFFAGSIAAIVVLARVLHVWLPGYIMGGFHYLSGYGDSMFLAPSGALGANAVRYAVLTFLLFFVCCLLLLISLIRRRQFLAQADALFLYAVVGMALFLLFKSGFIRADFSHIFRFFEITGFFFLFLYLYTPAGYGRKIAAVCSWAVLGISFVMSSVYLPEFFQPFRRLTHFSLLPIKVREVGSYFADYGSYDRDRARLDSLAAAANKYKAMIGDHPVDVIPLDIAGIYMNGLTYSPRPTLQSYSTNDGYLDMLDYKKYTEKGAPDFVLFQLGSVDGRFAWAEESRVYLALMSHYQFAGEIDGQLLLKRRDVPRALTPGKEVATKFKMGENLTLRRRSGLQFARFVIHYNLLGGMSSFFYQPPALKMIFTLADGEEKTCQVRKPALTDGFFINKYISDTREFQLLLNSDGRLNGDVKAIRLEPAVPGRNGFADEVTMYSIYYSFDEKPAAERLADSAAIATLVGGYLTLPALVPPPVVVPQSELPYGIEDLQVNKNVFRISGWASRKAGNHEGDHAMAVLRSARGVYALPSENTGRADLQAAHPGQDFSKAGFASICIKSQLPEDDYEWGIAVCDSNNASCTVTYTGKYLTTNDFTPVRIPRLAATPKDTGKIAYNIEQVGEDDEEAVIDGWAVLEHATGKTNTDLILQSDSATYRVKTLAKKRPDIAAGYHNPLFESSGFNIHIPFSSVPRGVYTIGIRKVDADGRERGYVFSNKKLIVHFTNFTPVMMTSSPAVTHFSGNIDQVKEDNDRVAVSGWALSNVKTVQQDSIRLVLKGDAAGYTVATNPVSRQDIVGRFNNPAVEHCGFSVIFSTESLPPGRYRLGILIHHKEGTDELMFLDQFITSQ